MKVCASPFAIQPHLWQKYPHCHTAVGNLKKKEKIFYHSTCWTEQICLRIWKVNSRNTLHFSQRQRKDERWWITYCIDSQRLVEQGLDRKWCHEYGSFYLTRIWSLAIKLQPEHLKLLSCSQARPENNLITHQPSQQGAKWRETVSKDQTLVTTLLLSFFLFYLKS